MTERFDYYEIRPCVERAGHVKSFLGEPQWCNSRGSHIRTPEAALEAAKAYQAKYGGKLFWTLYGMEDGIAAAIGDFKSFDAAFEAMNAILAPLAEARDAIREYQLPLDDGRLCLGGVADNLEDIILQSTMEDRL